MTEEMKIFYLRNMSLFSKSPDYVIQELCQILKFRTVYRGEAIGIDEGANSKVFFVLKGKVKITEGDDFGNEFVKELVLDGELFGDLGLDGNIEEEEVAEALTANTILAYCKASEFKQIIEQNPALALSFALKVSGKLKQLESRHADLVLRDAKSRLIRFIKNWAMADGSKIGDKIILNNYLTHSEIAGFISTSRQSVNVLLNELRDAGVLYYNRKKIELTNPSTWN